MQNKGALKLLIVALAIACLYMLSFTFVTQWVEHKATRIAAGDPVREQEVLDSLKSETVYNLGFIKFNYREVKDKEINLGLDLRGGMNVMLEIAVEDVVRALSNDNKDPIFNQALLQARQQQRNSTEGFISLFARSYEQLSGGGKLAHIFSTPELREYITSNSSNAEVVSVLTKQADDAIANSYNVLRSRIDRFGVAQPNIQRIGNTGRILVELPGVKEPERVRKLLQGTASLEFWATYENSDIYPLFAQINRVIREYEDAHRVNAQSVAPQEDATSAQEPASGAEDLLSQLGTATDSLALQDDAAWAKEYPLFAKLTPRVDPQSGQVFPGPVIGQAMFRDTAAVNAYFNLPAVRALLPRDVRLMWGVKPFDPAGNYFELFAIRANTRDGRAPLDGGAVVDARGDYSDRGAAAHVSMTMNAAGAKAWARLTADNVGRSIAIVLDGYVYSAPRVNQEITGGQSQITGNFTIQEANDLANVLKSGKLPAPARIIQEAVVGPSLGQESINSSMISMILAFLLVMLYMVVFYNRAGTVACVALVMNLFLIFGVLASFGAVLTLPGLAGIVLTLGLAVDANVIIYERVKEELKAGRGLSDSIKLGFKHAMSAIIDGNVTSLITGVVLFVFGTGPVQGFATTLIIGIITSFFTAVFVSRLIFTGMLARGKNVRFSNRFSENFLANTKINFVRMRTKTYVISGIMILVAAVSLVTQGLNLGVEFSGGRSFVVRFDRDVQVEEVRAALIWTFGQQEGEAGSKSVDVKQFGDKNQMRILTQYRYDDQSNEATQAVERLLFDALNPLYETPLTLDEFLTTATNPNGVVSADIVGPSVANDIKRNAVIAVIFSLIAIMLYIIMRFKRWQWGVGSVVSLAHDTFLTIGLYSICYAFVPFAMEVDQSFIAAILTIIGFSINDKVVVFDRIREYQRLYPKMPMKTNINGAINSTMSRTINTSGSTFVVLLAIFLFGGEVIRGFVFAMMFGVLISIYSTVFTAMPVAYDLMNDEQRGEKRKNNKKTAEVKA